MMRRPVSLFMEEAGKYVDFVAVFDGIETVILSVDKRLLNGPFKAMVIDYDGRSHMPTPEPELCSQQ